MNNHPHQLHHAAVEVLGLTPRLRDDLEIHVQVFGGQTCYVIEDPLHSRFCRVGVAEYTLLSLLDGKTSLADALGQTATLMGTEALSEQEASSLCKWLVDSQLATTQQSQGADRLVDVADTAAQRNLTARANPLFQKFVLFCPDRLVQHASGLAHAIFSRTFLVLWLVTTLWALFALWNSSFTARSHSMGVLAPNDWLCLIGTWLVLKLLHECGHALACKRFGGAVREAGVMFVLLAPLPFVDVTSSWRFDSKWKRIVTAAAGMYVELFVAAVAALIWASTDNPLVEFHARNVVVTATLVTLLFNANPLMRFDGYYILSDWLEHPNLATHGQQLLGWLLRRFLLGMQVERPSWPEGKLPLIASYAVAAFIWRVFISAVLIIAAEALLYGAGVVLALAALGLMLGVPAYRLVKLLRTNSGVDIRRVAWVSGASLVAAWGAWAWVPWYSSFSAPAIVDFDPAIEIRTPVSGFIRQALVRPGDSVTSGQLLAVLENRELVLEVERLAVQIEQSRQRARQFRFASEIAAFQVENDNRKALEVRQNELAAQVAGMQVRAPASGLVLQCDLHQRLGTYLESGAQLATLGDPKKLRIHAFVPQHELKTSASEQVEQGHVRIWGSEQGEFLAEVTKSCPRATTHLPYKALSAAVGGPLAVRPVTGADPEKTQWELIEPHVALVLKPKAFLSSHLLLAGQTGYVTLQRADSSLGQHLVSNVQRWLRLQRSNRPL